jgi:tetratricopeptide (TPR) repeat protein
LINRALKSQGQKPSGSGPLIMRRDEGAEEEKILLYLDAACIAAKQQQFEKSDKFLNDILSLPSMSVTAYGATASELASIYADNNRSQEAISFLQAVGSKFPMETGRTKSNSAFRANLSDVSGATIDYTLAKLFFESGKVDQARPIIESAIKKMRQGPTCAMCVLAANCAEKAKDYSAAAHFCTLAIQANDYGPMLINSGAQFAPVYWRKALAFADQAPNFDKLEKAKICIQLAESAGYQKRQEAYDMYKRALDLTPASDPEKASIAAKLAKLQSQLNGAIKAPADAAARSKSPSDPPAAPTGAPTASQLFSVPPN